MALLLIEAGGTRSTWYLLAGGAVLSQYDGAGFNVATSRDRVLADAEYALCQKADQAIVYLAGFDGSAEMSAAVSGLLGLDQVVCYSDLHAVWHAYDRRDGIFCLLGTGSQSFSVVGGKFTVGQPSLGYLVSDEGSGYAMGRSFLQMYLYGRLPPDSLDALAKTHDLGRAAILECLYGKGSPATYVASFTHVLSTYRSEDWAREIIYDALENFVDLRVACYPKTFGHEVYAAGGVAAAFRAELAEVLERRGYRLAQVAQSPAKHLINHYLSHS